jgi:hypothetical protein
MTSRLLALAVAVAALASVVGVSAGGAQEPAPVPAPPPIVDPCADPELLCPDLVMKRPAHLHIDRHTRRGRVLLRSRNSIDNIGLGPAALRGRRDGRKTMDAYQAVFRRDGSRRLFRTGARLYFQPIPGQYRYWKFADAARFELWQVDRRLRRTRRVRVGPKQNYCLRDLFRTRPSRRSPRRRVFPACSQDPRKRRLTLGTSVGWSDVYPAGYHQNWIDVTNVRRGRYALVHIADPKNGIHELDETNNESQVIVSLPSGRVRGRSDSSPDDEY